MPQNIPSRHERLCNDDRQVALPLSLHAVAEIENQPLPDAGSNEPILTRAIRKVRAWQQLQNGGFCARQQRAFQEA